MIALIGITIDRKVSSRSRNANRRTKPKTSGAFVCIKCLKSWDCAVKPLTPYSTPSSCPRVEGTTSSRRDQAPRTPSGPSPCRAPDRDDLDRALPVHVVDDRLVHAGIDECTPLQLSDRLLISGFLVVRLDHDGGRNRTAGERLLQLVVGLHRRQAATEGLRPGWASFICRATRARRAGWPRRSWTRAGNGVPGRGSRSTGVLRRRVG